MQNTRKKSNFPKDSDMEELLHENVILKKT